MIWGENPLFSETSISWPPQFGTYHGLPAVFQRPISETSDILGDMLRLDREKWEETHMVDTEKT